MVNGNSSTAAATGSKPLWSSDSDISKEPWLYYTTSRNVKNLSQAPPGERLTGYTQAILGNGRGGQNSQSAEGHGINPIKTEGEDESFRNKSRLFSCYCSSSHRCGITNNRHYFGGVLNVKMWTPVNNCQSSSLLQSVVLISLLFLHVYRGLYFHGKW